jgi:hypothetical protein
VVHHRTENRGYKKTLLDVSQSLQAQCSHTDRLQQDIERDKMRSVSWKAFSDHFPFFQDNTAEDSGKSIGQYAAVDEDDDDEMVNHPLYSWDLAWQGDSVKDPRRVEAYLTKSFQQVELHMRHIVGNLASNVTLHQVDRYTPFFLSLPSFAPS